MRFKERSHIYNIKVQREVANSDVVAAASYLDYLAQIIKVATLKSRLSSRQKKNKKKALFHSKREVNAWLQSFKGLTDLLEANTAGDLS